MCCGMGRLNVLVHLACQTFNLRERVLSAVHKARDSGARRKLEKQQYPLILPPPQDFLDHS